MEESAAQLFSRLGAKQSLGDISVPLFSHLPFGLKPGDAVEFQGDEGCGKSELLLNIAVNCVLPKSWNGVQLPEGRNVDVVYVSTDFKLDVLRLVDLLECRIGGALSKHGFQCDEELIDQCLSRVHVLYCKTSVEVVTALQSLKTYLHCNPNVCVLMLDNIATFYWIDKLQYASSNSMESRVAQGVEELMAEYHLVMFITKPQLFSSSAFGMSKPATGDSAVGSSWERLLKLRFEMRKCLPKESGGRCSYEVEQVYPARGQIHKVVIEQCGVVFS